jgi:hypothetical protein
MGHTMGEVVLGFDLSPTPTWTDRGPTAMLGGDLYKREVRTQELIRPHAQFLPEATSR